MLQGQRDYEAMQTKRDVLAYSLNGPGLTMECPLWSLHVDDAGEGGGGISGLNVSLGRLSALVSSLGSLEQKCVLQSNLLYRPPVYKDHLLIKTLFYRSPGVYFPCFEPVYKDYILYKDHILLVTRVVFTDKFHCMYIIYSEN